MKLKEIHTIKTVTRSVEDGNIAMHLKLARNVAKMPAELKVLEELYEKTKTQVKAYERKVEQINIDYCDKDEKGQPKIEKQMYHFSDENTDKRISAIAFLDKEYREWLDVVSGTNSEYNALAEKEVKYNPVKLTVDEVKFLTPDQLTGLKWLLPATCKAEHLHEGVKASHLIEIYEFMNVK